MGPLSAQAEYVNRKLDGGTDGDLEKANGYNVQLAYTLTGEARIKAGRRQIRFN